MNLISQLANNNGLLGLLLAIALLAIIYLFNTLMKEKDKELHDKDEVIERVTLVLRAVDNTEKAILIELQKDHEKEKTIQNPTGKS